MRTTMTSSSSQTTRRARVQVMKQRVQAHGDALAMRRAHVRSYLTMVAWRGRDHMRVDREHCELEEAIAARDEVKAAAARGRARYYADLVPIAVEEIARVEAAEEQVHVEAAQEAVA
jgi:hypothetical protein